MNGKMKKWVCQANEDAKTLLATLQTMNTQGAELTRSSSSVYITGDFTISQNITIPSNVDVSVVGDFTIAEDITIEGGLSVRCKYQENSTFTISGGKTVTVNGYLYIYNQPITDRIWNSEKQDYDEYTYGLTFTNNGSLIGTGGLTKYDETFQEYYGYCYENGKWVDSYTREIVRVLGNVTLNGRTITLTDDVTLYDEYTFNGYDKLVLEIPTGKKLTVLEGTWFNLIDVQVSGTLDGTGQYLYGFTPFNGGYKGESYTKEYEVETVDGGYKINSGIGYVGSNTICATFKNATIFASYEEIIAYFTSEYASGAATIKTVATISDDTVIIEQYAFCATVQDIYNYLGYTPNNGGGSAGMGDKLTVKVGGQVIGFEGIPETPATEEKTYYKYNGVWYSLGERNVLYMRDSLSFAGFNCIVSGNQLTLPTGTTIFNSYYIYSTYQKGVEVIVPNDAEVQFLYNPFDYVSSFVNNGEIIIPEDCYLYFRNDNNTFTNNGELTIQGYLQVDSLTNTGTIDVNGWLYANYINNTGTITQKQGGYIYNRDLTGTPIVVENEE